MAVRNKKRQRSPQQRTPAPQRRAKPAQRARPVAPVQQQRARPVVQQAPMQQQTPVSQPRNVAPVSQSLPRPMNPAVQPRPMPAVQPPPMPATPNAYAQHPVPSMNGAFRENGMQNPNDVIPTTRSPQQRATQQKMGILNNPPPPVQAPAAINQVGSIPRPASPTMETSPVQQQIAPVQQADPKPLTQETPYQAPLTPVTSATPTDGSGWAQPAPEVAPVQQAAPVPQAITPAVPEVGTPTPVAPISNIASTNPAPSVSEAGTPTPSVTQYTPSTTSATSVSARGGIGTPATSSSTPQPIIPDIRGGFTPPNNPNITPTVTPVTPTVTPSNPLIGDIRGGGVSPRPTPTTPTVTPTVPPSNPLIGDIRGGGVSPRPTPAIPPITPTIPPVTPTMPPVTPTVPPVTPNLPPSNPLIGDIRGGGVTPRPNPNIGTGAVVTGDNTGNQEWQNNSQAAATGSAQNPYSSIYGGMQDPLAYLQGQGIDIGEDYSRYFQGYDPAREQGAYQQYGLGQQAQMMGARAGLMGMTQQQGSGGFSGVGFGGAASSGIRGQFGLGQQQAALGLRGDIYGMRRAQEDSWWDTLARVEESRGEPFGMLSDRGTNYNETYLSGDTSGNFVAGDYRDQISGYTGDQTWMPPQNPSFDETYEFDGETYYWDPSLQEWTTGT